MRLDPVYPTMQHEQASKAIVEFFCQHADVEAVILLGSCARGKATRDSCLDILILVLPEILATQRAKLEQAWDDFYTAAPVFKAVQQVGKYSHVDLAFIDGQFRPHPRDWTSGPDSFELEIGNTLIYSVHLWERRDYLSRLKAQWLPYYDEDLRQKRLTETRGYCLNNLDHIPLYVERGLYFQSFHRLYDAFREFLQAVFITRRTYPIAYNKWIREQIEEILGLPELYQRLPSLFEIEQFESQQIAEKAKDLEALLSAYVG
ncbi:nucleotidyltransferase domain-containing protein [candidate division KSB1 bacterium]|nr:nucleotidyltransferase domain-containing protein [candidate division KSB1 bacterium]